mgnify:CR=1 FL=1
MAIVVPAALSMLPMPAMAADETSPAGPGMSALETIGIFVLLPVSLYGLVWLLWSIPHWRREIATPATGENWNPQPALK